MFIFAICIASCEQMNLNLQDDPNNISQSSNLADIDLLLNKIVFDMNNVQKDCHFAVVDWVRHINMFGTYASNASDSRMNFPWQATYRIDKNLKKIQEINTEKSDAFAYQVGVGQIAKAYSLLNLVDFIGVAVFDEANNPDISSPKIEEGKDVYPKIITLLDEGIANLKKQNKAPLDDPMTVLESGNDKNMKWIKFANTIKLKMYLQTRLVDSDVKEKINTIISEGEYIKTASDDFQFNYSTNTNPVDSRHSTFLENYDGVSKSGYMSNSFMKMMLDLKDPRIRYYIYRQTNSAPTGNKLPCRDKGYEYCYIGKGYWGRDHAVDDPLPDDETFRSIIGIYPIGGAYDNNAFVDARKSKNLDGKGINPIMLSSFVDFMLAEASLKLGTTGDAVDYLVSGVKKSFAKVGSFYKGNDGAITPQSTQTYINKLRRSYNLATPDEKLEIIAREYYTASFGNSIEAYNTYRRTGKPTLQSPQKEAGSIPRSFFIPRNEINSNSNAVQKKLTDRVFWDTNPENGFID